MKINLFPKIAAPTLRYDYDISIVFQYSTTCAGNLYLFSSAIINERLADKISPCPENEGVPDTTIYASYTGYMMLLLLVICLYTYVRKHIGKILSAFGL